MDNTETNQTPDQEPDTTQVPATETLKPEALTALGIKKKRQTIIQQMEEKRQAMIRREEFLGG